MSAIRLKPRSALAILLVSVFGVMANLWPLLISPESSVVGQTSGAAQSGDAPLIFACLMPLLLLVVLAEIADGGLDPKAIAMLGVLSALDAALRPLGAGTGGIEVMFFLLVLAGRVFGPAFGFALGSVSMFASALLTAGVGPWLPYQMLGASWVAMGAGLIPRSWRPRPWVELTALAAYGAFASLLYGFVLNMSFWPFATGGEAGLMPVLGGSLATNLQHFVAYCLATSLGWDLGRAITTVVLILLTGRGVLLALRRASRQANFDARAEFGDA